MKIFLISKKDQGRRLDSYLRDQIKGVSSKQIQNAMHTFGCIVNGKSERFASYKLRNGDKIHFDIRNLRSQDMSIKIIYEDEHLIIIDKPAHLVSEKKFLEKFFDYEIFLPHRLDKQTSGLMLLAKSERCLQLLEELFRERKVEKSYIALVLGEFFEDKQKIKLPIKRVSRFDGGGKWQVHPKGVFAETRVEKIRTNSKVSLVRCFPKTGRTHQIRVHLSEKNYPIVGDYFYGAKKLKVFTPRTCLHSEKLSFVHPITGQNLSFKQNLPQDFKSVLDNFHINYE